MFDQPAIERQQELLIIAAHARCTHFREPRAASPVSVKQLVTINLFVIAPQRFPRDQVMQAVFVQHDEARHLLRAFVNKFVMRIVAYLVEQRVIFRWIKTGGLFGEYFHCGDFASAV